MINLIIMTRFQNIQENNLKFLTQPFVLNTKNSLMQIIFLT